MPFWPEDSKSKIRARCPSPNLIKTHKPPPLESHPGKKRDAGERRPLETSFSGEFDKFAMDSCAGCTPHESSTWHPGIVWYINCMFMHDLLLRSSADLDPFISGFELVSLSLPYNT